MVTLWVRSVWSFAERLPGGCARRADRHAYGAGIGDGLPKRKHNSLLRACYSIQMICLDENRLCNMACDIDVTRRRNIVRHFYPIQKCPAMILLRHYEIPMQTPFSVGHACVDCVFTHLNDD